MHKAGPRKNFGLGMAIILLIHIGIHTNLPAQQSIRLGTDSTLLNYSPFVPFSSYGYTQTIYPASSLNFRGEINSIEIYSEGVDRWSDTVQVFIALTSEEYFGNPYDWIDPQDLKQVFDGELVFQAGQWSEIAFDSPFYYPGEGNLLLAFNNSTPDYLYSDKAMFGMSYLDMAIRTMNYYSSEEAFDMQAPQEQEFVSRSILNLKIKGDLQSFYADRSRVHLYAEAHTSDTLFISSSWDSWTINEEHAEWFDIRVDKVHELIVFESQESNTTLGERIDTVQIVVPGEDSIEIQVVQFPASGFASLGDEFLPYSYANKDFGDFDNDGDLDLLVSGKFKSEEYSEYRIELFENLGNLNFRRIPNAMFAGYQPIARFHDMDNDNDLDILVNTYYNSLEEAGEAILIYYENDDGFFWEAFAVSDEHLWSHDVNMAGNFNSISVHDFNNDGLQDVFVCGNNLVDDPQTQLYFGTGEGAFESSGHQFPGLNEACHSVEDVDADGDWDILFNGTDVSGNSASYFSENLGNDFNTKRLPIDAARSIAFSDTDQDREHEIIATGSETRFYKMDDQVDNPALYFSMPGSWWMLEGNFSPEGYGNDLLAVGAETFVATSKRYQSNYEISEDIVLPNGASGLPAMGDLDLDGDLEIFPHNKLFLNCGSFNETARPVPGNLSTELINGMVYMYWEPGILNPDDSLFSYNLSIGTHPDSCNVMPPLSDPETGFRKLVRKGNAGRNLNWKIRGLEPGTYYWRVQSVNSVYQGSAFSVQDSFVVLPVYEELDFRFQESNHDMGKWVDLDLDGDLDAVVRPDNRAILIQNNGNDLEVIDSIPGNTWGFEVCDINKDNRPDIMTYRRGEWNYEDTPDTLVFFMQNAEGKFDETFQIIPEMNSIEAARFCDFNNDGKTDLYLLGYSRFHGTFDPQAVAIYSDIFGEAVMVKRIEFYADLEYKSIMSTILDADLDGRLDIFVTVDQLEKSYLYRNKGGFVFEQEEVSITGYSMSDIVTGDFNNDSYPDILITGNHLHFGYETAVYLNEGGQDFERMVTSLPMPGSIFSKVGVNDVDNDGYLDFIMGGQELNVKLRLYINRQGKDFVFQENYMPEEYHPYSMDFGDFDGDQDSDILFFGRNLSGGIERMWPGSVLRNNINIENTAPEVPSSLGIRNDGRNTSLLWSPPESSGSSAESLRYNVRVGTIPGGSDVLCPLSDLGTGKLLVNQTCNSGYAPLFVLDALPVGDYYWSVQAVDHNHLSSSWSEEHHFSISFLRAGFKADTVCAGLPTQFQEEAVATDSEIDAWMWEFEGAVFSTERSPQYVFPGPGSYSVKLKVLNADYADSAVSEIVVLPAPVAGFNADVACVGDKTQFLNSTDPNGTQLEHWEWDFGDGTGFNDEHPGTHGYLNARSYDVRLVAFSGNGCTDTSTMTVVVADYPSSVITTNKTTGFCEGDSIVLSNAYATDYDYLWKVDGIPVTGGDSSNLTVRSSGDYSLVVTNRKGGCRVETDQVEVKVFPYPEQPVTLTQNYSPEGCPEEDPIVFTVENFSGAYGYSWMRNGIPIASAGGRTYSGFLTEADYAVVADNQGCSIESDPLTIQYADIPEQPEILAQGPEVWYLVCSHNTAHSYKWYFNDELIPEANSFLYVAGDKEGKYQLAISTEEGGCYSFSEPVWIPLGTGAMDATREGFSVYPNPSSGAFRIRLDQALQDRIHAQVTRVDGALVWDEMLDQPGAREFSIDLSQESPGMYLLKLYGGQRQYTAILLLQ